MQSLNFNDGYKEYSINGDESKIIRVNLSDFSIIERIKTAYDEIEIATTTNEEVDLKTDGTPVSELDKAAEIVKGINDTIKRQIDYIFNSEVSAMVFGNQSPLSMVGGIPLYERFLMSVTPVIQAEIMAEQKASQKRINKYTKVYHK